MKRALAPLGLCTLLVAVSPPSVLASTTIAGGNIPNQTWTTAGSPYIIQGDITVPAGAFLTIQPGVTVQVAASDGQAAGVDTSRVEVIINGTLTANGTSGSHITFSGLTAGDARWYGIRVGATASVSISYADISDVMVGVESQMNGLSVSHSHIFTSATIGVNIQNGSATLDANLIDIEPSNVTSTPTGIQAIGAGHGTFINNVLIVNGTGIYMNPSSSTSTSIVNDTIVTHASGTGISLDHAGNATYAATIANTIVTGGSVGILGNVSGSTITLTNNDVRNVTAYSGTGLPAPVNSITSDPSFVSVSNFHLSSNSPCIDAGTLTGAPDHDFDGTPRPAGSMPDIGAFEFVPPNDFSISAAPSTVAAKQGSQVTTTISTLTISGAAQTVALSITGLPAGATASFAPGSVQSGASSTLTLTPGSSTAVGSYLLTVTGTAASGMHSTNVTLNTVAVQPTVVALDKTVLVFAATTSPSGALSAKTPAQAVRLTESGTVTAAWIATPNQPWVTVSPSSGAGSAVLSVSVLAVPGLTASQTATITISAASTIGGPIAVVLNTTPVGSSKPPFGSFDTPLNGSTGLAGSIAVTGWALDDIGIARVRVVRDPVPGEGAGLVFIGNAVLIDGARPDVSAGNQSIPQNTTGGWGYLLLTNFLPNQGNGTFTLHALADDAEGNTTDLGTKTITCANSASAKPFGAIDTPGQGDIVSGVVGNFGWTLIRNPGGATPPRADIPGGATVNVFVDGVSIGSPTGWTSRPDLTGLFPTGYSDLSSTLALFGLDTTTLANGVHTIAWAVTATNGQSDGIGSRFFTVSNGSLAFEPLAPVASISGPGRVADLQGSTALVTGRRGFDLAIPYRTYDPDADGLVVVQAEELDRIELLVGATSGSLTTQLGVAPLPIGSHLDPATGTFTWAPGVGFVGPYDFVFRSGAAARHVRIVLNPKGSARVGPQVVIDAPRPDAFVAGRFLLAGWAADLSAASGTGIDALHVWAYPIAGGDPVFVGVAQYGGTRPDVAAVYGDQFRDTGYGIIVDGLAPGTYNLAVFGWSAAKHTFLSATVVRATVR